MEPKHFSELEFTPITLETARGAVRGLFSELRVNIATIPGGLIPYDIRYGDDDDAVPTHIKTFVSVNYFGTVIVNAPLDFGGCDHIGIVDWNFEGDTDDYPQWMREFITN